MRPIFRWGNMPSPIAAFHKRFKTEVLGGEEDAEGNYCHVWECNDPGEVVDWIKMHPLIPADDPSKTIQPIIDRKTGRVFIVAIGLADRITIGDIDITTGEIIPGYYEKHPTIVFSETTDSWIRAIFKSKNKGTKQINRELAKEYAKEIVGKKRG